MNVINPFDFEELIEQIKHEYGFDLKKDLKDTKLNKNEFTMMLQDLFLSVTGRSKRSYRLYTKDSCIAYKTRHRDDNRNIGAPGAYRLVSICDGEKLLPVHLYHKKSGKRPKSDLSQKEKAIIKKMVDDLADQKEGN